MTKNGKTRPSLKRAVEWLVANDDCEYVRNYDFDRCGLSVAASLVADLFGVEDEVVYLRVKRLVEEEESK